MGAICGEKEKRRGKERIMGSTKFDIEKFSGSNDFGLWKIKMEAILVQQGCAEALKGIERMSSTLTLKEKEEMVEKARSAIILCLGDKALREVARENTATALWLKLETLYMTKSVSNRLLLKQQLFSFKMTEERSLIDQMAEYNKILDDLENLEVKLEDEDKALILLSGLLNSYEHFKDAIRFGRDHSTSLTLEEVQTSIRTKILQKKQEQKTEGNGESLNVMRGKPKKGGSKGNKQKSKTKNQS